MGVVKENIFGVSPDYPEAFPLPPPDHFGVDDPVEQIAVRGELIYDRANVDVTDHIPPGAWTGGMGIS